MSAAEGSSQNYTVNKTVNSVVQPLKTCYGNGGTAKIENPVIGSIWWYVNPSFSTAYSFVGTVTISNDKGSIVSTIPVSEVGTAGKALTGVVNAPRTNGKSYIAELDGVARDSQGFTSFVVPLCDVPYVY